MNMIKTALIALAVVSASTAGAFARDGVAGQMPVQSGTDTFYSATVVDGGSSAVSESADHEIRQNELGQR